MSDQTLIREKSERNIPPPVFTNCTQKPVFPHKTRPIVGLRLVVTAIYLYFAILTIYPGSTRPRAKAGTKPGQGRPNAADSGPTLDRHQVNA